MFLDPSKTYVHGEFEVMLTGRYAVNDKGKSYLVEIEPVEQPKWKKFVRVAELYEIVNKLPSNIKE